MEEFLRPQELPGRGYLTSDWTLRKDGTSYKENFVDNQTVRFVFRWGQSNHRPTVVLRSDMQENDVAGKNTHKASR